MPESAYLWAFKAYSFAVIFYYNFGSYYSSSAGGLNYYPAYIAAWRAFYTAYLFYALIFSISSSNSFSIAVLFKFLANHLDSYDFKI